MAILSNVGQFLGGADNVSARIILQGQQFTYGVVLEAAEDVPHDITGWVITATAEFYKGTIVTTETSIAISNAVLDPRPVINLTVNVTDAANGRLEILVPTDLYEDNIPTNISENVPFVVIYCKIQDDATTPEIDKFRHILVIRRSL